MTNLKNIEKFLLAEIAADLGKQSLDPDEDLIEQRIIDSLGILKLVSFLEEAHGIQVIDEVIVPENFQSINTMVKFVEQKQKMLSRPPLWSKPCTDAQPEIEILPMMPLQ